MRAMGRLCRGCNRTDRELGTPVDPRDGLCWSSKNDGYAGCYGRFHAWVTARYNFNPAHENGLFIDWRKPESQVLFDKWLEVGNP